MNESPDIPNADWPNADWLAVGAEVADSLSAVDPLAFRALVEACADRGGRWFFSGQGRSGLVARMAAMRFMHAGFASHFAGEATAPSVRAGDKLLLVSGSGETPVSLGYAHIARAEGARVLAVTAKPASTLAGLADVVMPVPLPRTRQFGGSLFEQASLLILDALVLSITAADEAEYRAMAFRHTNLQ